MGNVKSMDKGREKPWKKIRQDLGEKNENYLKKNPKKKFISASLIFDVANGELFYIISDKKREDPKRPLSL